MRLFKILIFLLLFISCDQKPIVKTVLFPTGKIQFIQYFSSKTDINPFMQIDYFENGVVSDTLLFDKNGLLDGKQYYNFPSKNYHRWSYYKNGVRVGLNLMDYNDGRRVIQHYKNNVLHGIEYQWNQEGLLNKNILWINGVAIFLNKSVIVEKGDSILNFIKTSNGSYFKNEIISEPLLIDTYYDLEKQGEQRIVGSLAYNKSLEIPN